jgi:hypothetical protein
MYPSLDRLNPQSARRSVRSGLLATDGKHGSVMRTQIITDIVYGNVIGKVRRMF